MTQGPVRLHVVMNGLLTQLLRSPRLVELQRQIDRTLGAERTIRGRFRDQLDEDRREEFVNGEVVLQVSTSLRHADVLRRLDHLLATFVLLRQLGKTVREQALVEFPRNDYCPDLCFWPAAAGIGDDPARVVFPPPAFVVEVLSPSTEQRDRGVKFEDYEAHGVKEYWIVDPDPAIVEQYVEQGGTYQRVFTGSTGTIRSVAIPGFEIPAEAAFDDAAQMAALRAMLRG